MPGSAGEMSPFSFSEDSLRFRHKTTHSFLFGNRIFTFLEIFNHFLFKEDIFLDTIPKFLFLIFFFQPFLLLNVSFKEEAVSCFRGKHPKHLDSHHKDFHFPLFLLSLTKILQDIGLGHGSAEWSHSL